MMALNTNGKKISSLARTDKLNDADVLPFSSFLENGFETKGATLSGLRSLLYFEHAVNSEVEGLEKTVSGQYFHVWRTSEKLYVDEYINADGFAQPSLDDNGVQKSYTTPYAIIDAINKSGQFPVGTFSQGYTLENVSQVLLNSATGSFCAWRGNYPKVVPADSTPESTGGFGRNAWVDVNDLTLRTDLFSPDGGEIVKVKPRELSAPRILSDYFSDFVNLLNIDGFRGDGRDESDIVAYGAQLAVGKNVPLIIPHDRLVGINSGTLIPVGTKINVRGQLSSLSAGMFSFFDPLFYESMILSQSLAGETFVIVDNADGFRVGDVVAVKYKYPTDDATYNAIAQNPMIMGYQRQIMRVKRIEAGHKVVFGQRLLWDITEESTLSTVTDKSTDITMGNSGRIVCAHSGYLFDGQVSRLSISGGEIDFSGIAKGMRFSGSHFNRFSNLRFLNSVGGNTLFFGYGSCSNQISHTVFTGQQDGDAQLCFYAGGYGNTSSFNQFINGDNTNNRGAVMFGAKTWNNLSVGDVVHGGFYGMSSFFGAQRNVFRDSRLVSQTYAGFFLEDSQFTLLDNPQVTFPYSNETETIKGGIVFKACDGNTIDGGRVETKGSPTVSLYDDAGIQVQRNGLTIRGLKTHGGDVKIYHAIKDMRIEGLNIKNGSFIHYYSYSAESNGYVDIEVDNGNVMLSSFSYSHVKVRIDANATKEYGLILRGFGVYSTVVDSYVANATVAAYQMAGPYPQTSTSLDPYRNISVNCPAFIEGGITQTTTPVCPRIPPAGFYLPVNSFDPTQARTRMGYRAKGNTDATYRQWLIINANEALQ